MTTEPQELFLDLCGLFPPEPMERVLDALSKLAVGQQVRMLIDREPLPLYRILERNGYLFEASATPTGLFEIVIREGV